MSQLKLYKYKKENGKQYLSSESGYKQQDDDGIIY